MSDPDTLFTVTLTAAELNSLRDLLGKAAEEWGPWSGDARILEALDAAKPVRATRARAPRPAAEPFSPNTGSAAVDEFMIAHHRGDWEARLQKALRRNVPGMMAMPSPPPGFKKRPMTQGERADLYRIHVIRSASAYRARKAAEREADELT